MERRIKAEEQEYRRRLGERLQRVRSDKGLTKTALAAAAEMFPQHLSRYECGEVTPTAFTLDRLARALDVSPGWLLSGPKAARTSGRPEPMVCSTGVTMGPEMIDPEFRNRRARVAGNGKTGPER